MKSFEEMPPPSGGRNSTWLAYLICVVVAGLLLLGWLLGPPVGTWAQKQNRRPAEMPVLSASFLTQRETYERLGAVLDDSLRIKPLLTEAVNRMGLELFGLSLSPKVTTASLAPEWFRGEEALTRQLFYTEDFTNPPATPLYRVQQGLSALAEAFSRGSRTGFVVVAPNKSTVLLNNRTSYQRALMASSLEWRKALVKMEAQGLPLVVMTPADVYQAEPNEPYWSGDTHWKPTAALSLVAVIKQELRLTEGPSQETSRGSARRLRQGLLGMLLITREFEAEGVPNEGRRVEFDTVPLSNGGTATTFTNLKPSISGKSALLVVDSFTLEAISTRLCSLFSSGMIVRWEALPFTSLPEADVVIFEVVERAAYARISSFSEDIRLLSYIEGN